MKTLFTSELKAIRLIAAGLDTSKQPTQTVYMRASEGDLELSGGGSGLVSRVLYYSLAFLELESITLRTVSSI